MPVRFGSSRSRHIGALVTSAAVVGAILSALGAAFGATAAPVAHHPARVVERPATLTPVHVPGTKAMSTAAVDLADYGYTEKEYYASGKAHRYRGADAAATTTAAVVDGNHPYTTRVLVRAPKPSRFNGTLIVEWTNVTIGLDADFVFAEANKDLLRRGYAYAVVSAQKVGVDRLKTWSPKRYGKLSVDASNVDPVGGGDLDSCGTSPCAGDPLSWDVFTQVAKALKVDRGAHAPLPGLHVKNVIATGQSQSSARLTAYYNAIQPLTGFFDGFLLWDRATAKLRPEVEVPAISINSEGLSPLYAPFGTSKYTREWELAGSTHGSIFAERYVDRMFDRDKGLLDANGHPESFTAWIEPSCTVTPAFSTVPNGLVITAGMNSVRRWITTGKAAAPSIYFKRSADGTLLRDGEGKVLGGVRLSQFVASTAANVAINGTAFPCSVSGSHRYYTKQELKARYGSHHAYVRLVAKVALRTAKAGYELPDDAAAAVRQAARSDVAR